MEINRENFDAVFPKVKQLLKSCEFFAFDLEMTGINPTRIGRGVDPEILATKPHSCRFFSTPDELFASKWEAATTFSPMQLGLSIFHPKSSDSAKNALRAQLVMAESTQVLQMFESEGKERALSMIKTVRQRAVDVVAGLRPLSEGEVAALDTLTLVSNVDALIAELESVETFIQSTGGSKQQEYVASTFFCHLFPSWHFGDGELKMSMETVGDFLASHHMDFNAWVRTSLLYAPREALIKSRLERVRSAATVSTDRPVSAAAKFNQDLLADIPHTDVGKVSSALATLERFAEENANDLTATKPKAVPFFNETASYQAVTNKAKSLGLKLVSGTISWADRSVTGGSKPTSTHQGTLLIEAMFNAGRPVIAHNSWSDLVFLYRATHSTPLQSYAQFKEVVNKLFPTLYDTRTLCSLGIMQPIGNVRGPLDKTYELFRKKHESVSTRVMLSDGFAEGTQAPHNAGFDAFMTGSLFLYCREEILSAEGNSNLAANQQTADKTARSSTLMKLRSIIPVYASIFSIALRENFDVLIQSPSSPVFYAVPDSIRGGAFTDRLGTMLKRALLPAVVMNCGDAALAFVTNDAEGTKSSPGALARCVEAVKKSFTTEFGTGARLIDMGVGSYMQSISAETGRTPLNFLEI